MQQINETRDKGFFTEVRKLAGFLIPIEASTTPSLNHEATACPFVKGWARWEPAHGEDYPSLNH